jgi:RNA polymerase sigma factor (sigma-70 family)
VPHNTHELDAWVMATAPRAIAYARSLLVDWHRAEDVVQDCYCRLLARADIYDLPNDGLKLLLRAVTNACINATQRRRAIVELADDPASQVPSPDALAMHGELSDAVQAGLQLLPPLQRAALELKALGQTQSDIGLALGVSPSHAGVLIHRARRTLALQLAPFLEVSPVATQSSHDDA